MTNKALLKLSADNTAHTALVCKALASEVRLQMLAQLTRSPASVTELAAWLELPVSTASGHLQLLEEAGLISITPLPGSRGSKKVCNVQVEAVEVSIIRQLPDVQFSDCLYSQDMPVGNYFDYRVSAPCGIASAQGFLAPDDDPAGFAVPGHVNAQLLWFTHGYLEYHFSLGCVEPAQIERLEFSFEACAEAYGYNESWRSDVSLWLNGTLLGVLACRGDHGGRPGAQNPAWWPRYATQFGDLHRVILSSEGCHINGQPGSDLPLQSLLAQEPGMLRLRLGVEPGARYAGGLNLFGPAFGEHPQGIRMQVFGRKAAD